MINVALIIPSFKLFGGAEAFFLQIGRLLAGKDDLNIHLIVLTDDRQFFPDIYVNEKITYHFLSSSRLLLSFARVRKLITDLDIKVVFTTVLHSIAYFGLLRLFFPRHIIFVARISTFITSALYAHPILYNFIKYSKLLNRYDGVISLTECMEFDLLNNLSLDKSKSIVVPNFYSSNIFDTPIRYSTELDRLVYIGRLDANKSVDRIIRALSSLSKNYTLDIIGDGDCRSELVSLSEGLGLSDRVAFHGFQKNVDKYLQKSDILILSSNFEGFPNVFLDAIFAKRFIVSTPFLGVECILKDYPLAFLSEDFNSSSIARAVGLIYTRYRNLPIPEVEFCERYSPNSVAKAYYKIIQEKIHAS